MTAILIIVGVIATVWFMKRRCDKKLKAANWPEHTGHSEGKKRLQYDRHGRAYCTNCKRHHHGKCK